MLEGFILNVLHPSVDIHKQLDSHDSLGIALGEYGYIFKEITRVTKGNRLLHWFVLKNEAVTEKRIARIVFDLYDMNSYYRLSSEQDVVEVNRSGEEVLRGEFRIASKQKLKRRKDYFEFGDNTYIIITRRKQ